MRKKSIIGIIVVIIVAVITYFGYQTASGGNSSSKSSSSSDTPVLKVATTGVSFPGSYKDDDGKLTGFDVEVIKAVADKIGYDVDFTTTSFDGLFGLLTSHKVDVVASSIAITDEREKTYDFSTPYATFQYGVVTKSDSDLTSVDDLDNATIAATVGSNQIKVLQNFNSTIQIQTYDDREAALSAVTNGQVDGYSNAKAILSAIIDQKGLDLKIPDGEIGEESIAIAFNKGEDEELREKVDDALAELQKDGTISALSKKFFSGIDASYQND
ncbi:glutamine ABC transporter, glutamine-binding protein/permease protein [Streptococcus infantarius subsp. infantarius]|nr:glutamine ABC transporter, glutamine-binding protein/permease protein [Streptococcus infantarius subsp. infantarius]MCO4513249.1 glutamine ABC transporter, glutamine-binding protein/permease protein [Streptococcus infantarius subsp. infantarius]MCO4514775.1 glutamine ABC transporter, glutamine-binding protein/permease protein [Streptococcus infantarius subsp. infantarius]